MMMEMLIKNYREMMNKICNKVSGIFLKKARQTMFIPPPFLVNFFELWRLPVGESLKKSKEFAKRGDKIMIDKFFLNTSPKIMK